MITVFLRGGLGNQMFQYAAGLALAKKRGTSVSLDTTYLADRFPRKQFTFRNYDMDIFAVKPSFTFLSKVSKKFPVPGLWLAIDMALMHLASALSLKKLVREKDERVFDSELLNEPSSSILYGRWQSDKYFLGVADELRKDFTFRNPLEGEALRFADEIKSSNSVALCVRRGDFIAHQHANAIMGDTNLAYYTRGLEYIRKHVENPKIVVFCDDVAWCKENLPVPADSIFIGPLGPKWSFHLELMSLCKHAIIANSTFYWWGAWLNANPEKIIVAPSPWYADGKGSGDDILPEEWVRL